MEKYCNGDYTTQTELRNEYHNSVMYGYLRGGAHARTVDGHQQVIIRSICVHTILDI